MRNRAVTDLFEPGSVFKVVAASAALERDLVKPQQIFNAEKGEYSIYLANGRLRNRITDVHPYGLITFQQAIEFSSNIVVAKISDRIGSELLFTTARQYGFGTETGIDLPGEINGDLKRPDLWSGTTLNSMSYGYEVGVTPLQIAMAYAAVANKGVLLRPYIVQKVVNAEGEMVLENRRQVVRSPIGPATARTLTQFFEGVVLRGTGKQTAIPGVRVAGKTGTARKFIDGKYEPGRSTASFVGFFPAEEPRVVGIVMLDHPQIGGGTGGEASAPIFRAIASKIYAMSGRFRAETRTMVAEGRAVVVPDVQSLAIGVAKEMLSSRGFVAEVRGSGPAVGGQSPRPGTVVTPGTTVRLTAQGRGERTGGLTEVPDLRGMPIRRAINTLTVHELEASIRGSGVVRGQSPRAGERVRVGTRVALVCEGRGKFIGAN
jgi:cell division protein FtsI (penicillin-binding protein 3)